jgi:IS5 family transposase
MLLLSTPDSQLRQILEEAHRLVVRSPAILALIEADLDALGLRKKALRIADKKWKLARVPVLPGIETASVFTEAEHTLGQGRSRTSAYVVFVAAMLRGYFGEGFKACDVVTMMLESTTLAVLFANLGVNRPKASTFTDVVNAVTNATRQRILDEQIAMVLHLRWDDFREMLQDSTHVAGNSEWPTDSRLLVTFVARLVRVGASLWRLGLPTVALPKVQRYLAVMTDLDREIDMTRKTREGKRLRRRRYDRLLRNAGRSHRALSSAVSAVEAALDTLDLLPSRMAMATRVVTQMRADVTALQTVIDNCEARVIEGKKVPMADKKLSASDPDVGYIAKGQRNAVIGYKPQVARSGAGFITGILLPKGNASDSGQLVPMVDEVIRRTTVVPRVVSVDDGYASGANVDALRKLHIEVVSINGSKGKALTADADWESDEYAYARDMRSAIESLMFTLKQGFNFGEVARRGLDAVYGELLEKALAFNLCHMVRTRRAVEILDDELLAEAA